MKIFLALLTSSCIPRLKRLVKSVQQIQPVEGIFLQPVVVVNSTDPAYFESITKLNLPYPIFKTPSNGRPGKGKNSCNELFLTTDFDFISQIDGDDILYPTFLKSISNHLKHYPNLDVLGTIPTDLLVSRPLNVGHEFSINSSLFGCVWGTSMHFPKKNPGPGQSHIWDYEFPSSVDYIILQSKKGAKIRYSESISIAEDHLYSYQLLKEHQQGRLRYFITMSSDLYLIDRTNINSVQKTDTNPEISMVKLREEVLKILPKNRSSLFELPFIYKELLLSKYDKEKWIKHFISCNPILGVG